MSGATPAIFALVDCDNFFVSCERLFRPDLAARPVVVLSSNDGCVVARSNEAKALGIPMGAPAFRYRHIFREHGVCCFSANPDLYGNISRRVTGLLAGITPRLEIYSVDESFLDISTLPIASPDEWGRQVRQRIGREVGIPVSIGIARTKTLAKLATFHAKQDPALGGVLDITQSSPDILEQYCRQTPLGKVWGIGRRLAPQLQALGIRTAWDLACLRPGMARQLLGVRGPQLLAELTNTSCLPLERPDRDRQTISQGRTFGQDTDQLEVIEAVIASLTAEAGRRLRRNQLLATRASLSVATNRFRPGSRVFEHTVRFDPPTADTGLIAGRLVAGWQTLFQTGQSYHRAHVMLHDLVPAHSLQTDLLRPLLVPQHQRSADRMRAIDHINRRFGAGRIRYAAEDLARSWRPRHSHSSPHYVTDWSELPQLD